MCNWCMFTLGYCVILVIGYRCHTLLPYEKVRITIMATTSNNKPEIADTVEPMTDESLPFDESYFLSELQNKEYSDLPESVHLFLQNILIAAPCTPIYGLSESLTQEKVPLLKLVAKLYGIKGYSSMTKARLVSNIAETITNTVVLKWFLESLEESEWELFKKIVNSDHIIDDLVGYMDIAKLSVCCLVYVYRVDMHIYYVVPHEIRRSFFELEKKDFSAKNDHALMLNKYACATTNLYGVIKKSDFVSIFNKQNKRKTTETEINEILFKFKHLLKENYADYILLDDYLISYEYDELDDEELLSIIKEHESYPRYLPKKDELLNYADLNHMEDSPQLRKLQLFIDESFTLDADEAESLLEKMYFTAHVHTDVQEYVKMLKEHNIRLSQEKRNVLANLINDLAVNVRLWYYNGHTITELLTMGVIERKSAHTSEQESYRNVLSISDAEGFKYHSDNWDEHTHYDGNALQPKNEPVRVVKIGRNETCPCGSGKKYKRCCGS